MNKRNTVIMIAIAIFIVTYGFVLFRLSGPFDFQYANPNDYAGWRIMDTNRFSNEVVLFKDGKYETVYFPSDYIGEIEYSKFIDSNQKP